MDNKYEHPAFTFEDYVNASKRSDPDVIYIEEGSAPNKVESKEQFGRLFSLVGKYREMNGVEGEEELDSETIENATLDYKLLPPFDLSEEQISVLGKLLIIMFKNIGALDFATSATRADFYELKRRYLLSESKNEQKIYSDALEKIDFM